jgi:hypothetical protein
MPPPTAAPGRPPQAGDRLLTPAQVAEILGGSVTAETVVRRWRKWELPARRVGRELRFWESSVYEWITNHPALAPRRLTREPGPPRGLRSLITRSVVTVITHGRTKQRPAPVLAVQRDVSSKTRASQLSGWVRSALTQPRTPIVGAARNLSNTERFDRTRPARAAPPPARHRKPPGHRAPGTQGPARPKARPGAARPQATQGKPPPGVRPESGTPARRTGHQYPHRP